MGRWNKGWKSNTGRQHECNIVMKTLAILSRASIIKKADSTHLTISTFHPQLKPKDMSTETAVQPGWGFASELLNKPYSMRSNRIIWRYMYKLCPLADDQGHSFLDHVSFPTDLHSQGMMPHNEIQAQTSRNSFTACIWYFGVIRGGSDSEDSFLAGSPSTTYKTSENL